MISILKKLNYGFQFKRLLNKKSTLSVEEALNNLYRFYPGRETSPAFKQDVEVHLEVDLMIVIPVYNVEKYLKVCIESILKQKTKYSYKIVIVNDGSTDNSGIILNNYKGYSQIDIINQINQGPSVARNRALQTIVGRYVMFVDSDDYLPEDAIDKLLDIAYANNADIVEGDICSFNKNDIRSITHQFYGVNNMNSSNLFGYAWGKVISSECMKKVCFPKGYLYEDTIMSTILHPMCSKICITSEKVYNYRLNQTGRDTISLENKQAIDTFWLTKYCLEEFLKRNNRLTQEQQIQYFDQIRLNFIRLARWQNEIQESIFIVYCDLYKKYFGMDINSNIIKRYHYMKVVLASKSYDAYLFLMQHWDSLL